MCRNWSKVWFCESCAQRVPGLPLELSDCGMRLPEAACAGEGTAGGEACLLARICGKIAECLDRHSMMRCVASLIRELARRRGKREQERQLGMQCPRGWVMSSQLRSGGLSYFNSYLESHSHSLSHTQFQGKGEEGRRRSQEKSVSKPRVTHTRIPPPHPPRVHTRHTQIHARTHKEHTHTDRSSLGRCFTCCSATTTGVPIHSSSPASGVCLSICNELASDENNAQSAAGSGASHGSQCPQYPHFLGSGRPGSAAQIL